MSATLISEKLKAALLQSAIQGKLTQQRPEDGDARDLLKQIKAEKERLINEKVIKKEKPLPEITEDEIPFDIPDNWVWVRLGDVSIINPRNKIDDNLETAFIPMAYIRDGYCNEFVYDKKKWKAIKKGFTHFADNDLIIAKITPCFQNRKSAVLQNLPNGVGSGTTELHVVRVINNLIDPLYLLCLSKSNKFINDGIANFTGTAGQQRIGINFISNYLLPLPPITEQKRIIKAVSNALAKIDKLKVDETKLYNIQKAFPTKLRASLLQSAIQGKLTQQLPEDGDARDLLKQIEAEKERLINKKVIKKEKPLPEITEDEIPFDIPDNWVWVRLGELSSYIQRGKSPKYSQIKKYPVISQKCVQWTGFDISVAKFIDPDSFSSYLEERILQDNDLLWNSTGTGTVGRITRYQQNLNFYNVAVADSHVSVIRFFSKLMNPIYIESFIKSAHIQQDIEYMCTGTTKQKELNLSTIKSLLIPLPPLTEQHRIVETIEKALAKIDKLNKLTE